MNSAERICTLWLDNLRNKQSLCAVQSDHTNSQSTTKFKWETARGQQSFLHVGCGGSKKQDAAPGFRGDNWRGIRLDMDVTVAPDAAVDAIYSSHNIEHLYAHEVLLAFAEFYRVLKPSGFLVLTCPDLRSICCLVVEDKLDAPAYVTSSGETIAALDVIFGHRRVMAEGNLFMAHRYSFTQRTLMKAAKEAGFKIGHSIQRPATFDLWLLAIKSEASMDTLMQQAQVFLPMQN